MPSNLNRYLDSLPPLSNKKTLLGNRQVAATSDSMGIKKEKKRSAAMGWGGGKNSFGASRTESSHVQVMPACQ